jgi:hypothetical protein
MIQAYGIGEARIPPVVSRGACHAVRKTKPRALGGARHGFSIDAPLAKEQVAGGLLGMQPQARTFM